MRGWKVASPISPGVVGKMPELWIAKGDKKLRIVGSVAELTDFQADFNAASGPEPAEPISGYYVTFATPNGILSSHIETKQEIRSHADVLAIARALAEHFRVAPVTLLSWVPMPKENLIVAAASVPERLKGMVGA